MQQKLEDGLIFIRGTDKENADIRRWRLMNYDKKNNVWYGEVSIALLEKLQKNGGLIPPARAELNRLIRIQNAVDRERVKPDEEIDLMVNVPIKVKPFTHQKRAINMALMVFGLIDPLERKDDGLQKSDIKAKEHKGDNGLFD